MVKLKFPVVEGVLRVCRWFDDNSRFVLRWAAGDYAGLTAYDTPRGFPTAVPGSVQLLKASRADFSFKQAEPIAKYSVGVLVLALERKLDDLRRDVLVFLG